MTVLPRWWRQALPRGAAMPADVTARRLHVARLSGEVTQATRAPRVLVPTRGQLAAGVRVVDAPESEIPSGARSLRDAARAGGWRYVRATYALAEVTDAEGLDLVTSIAVRVSMRVSDLGAAPGQSAFGVWQNGRYEMGWLCEGLGHRFWRRVGLDELTCFIDGREWVAPAPPDVGPCPLVGCGQSVRFTKAGAPYKHACAGVSRPVDPS